MKSKVVRVPSIAQPICRSPGFEKKRLSEYKLDLMALCGFGCRYCSSNWGNYLRINRERFADLTEQQLGTRTYPDDDPGLTMVWPDLLERLEMQLRRHPPSWGAGRTLVFSMLTDGFSPVLLQAGTTEQALRLVLDRTSFRIRVLTKNAAVGSAKWIQFFREYPGRSVVGLSLGTLDDQWASRVEIGTSPPSARLRSLRRLQEAGVPTYGMLCPVFPDVLDGDGVERLLDAIQPEVCEHVWAEPYNDRTNWQAVRDGYATTGNGFHWLTEVYGRGRKDLWSRYATNLYLRLRTVAHRDGWLSKLCYLLYEDLITATDAPVFHDLRGVLLQSKPGPDGRSPNPHIAQFQTAAAGSVMAGAPPARRAVPNQGIPRLLTALPVGVGKA